MLVIVKVLILLLLALLFEIRPAHAQEVLTLERAIAGALKENSQIRNSEIETKKLEEMRAILRTRRFPSFKISALVSQPVTRMTFRFEKGQFGSFPATGPIPDKTTEIRSSMTPTALISGQIQQPISQLFSIGLNIRRIDLDRDLAAEQIRLKRQSTVAAVKTAYFQIMQTEGMLKSADEFVRLNREIHRVTEQFVKQGSALIPEQMASATKLAQAELDIMILKNRAATQKEQLNLLLGRDIRTAFEVVTPDSFLDMCETDLAAAQKRALGQRPEIRQAELKVNQSKLDVKIKRADFIPTVGISASYLSPFSYSGFLPKNIVSVGISVEWEVFDWGRKKRELAEKQLSVGQTENTLRDAVNQVLIEVNLRFRQLKETAVQLRVAQMAQRTASANLQVAIYRYEQQTILYKDVLQFQTALAEAETNYRNALLSFWTAKADFEKALGEEK